MGLRDELVALGLPIPEEIPLDRWAQALGHQPCQNTLALVGLSTVLFYAAERHRNPKVNDIYDSLVYCSTCISVGYADIFAKTPIGKIIGSALMTLGPAMAARTLDGPAKAEDPTQQQILQTLREILSRLESQPTLAQSHSAGEAAGDAAGDGQG